MKWLLLVSVSAAFCGCRTTQSGTSLTKSAPTIADDGSDYGPHNVIFSCKAEVDTSGSLGTPSHRPAFSNGVLNFEVNPSDDAAADPYSAVAVVERRSDGSSFRDPSNHINHIGWFLLPGMPESRILKLLQNEPLTLTAKLYTDAVPRNADDTRNLMGTLTLNGDGTGQLALNPSAFTVYSYFEPVTLSDCQTVTPPQTIDEQ